MKKLLNFVVLLGLACTAFADQAMYLQTAGCFANIGGQPVELRGIWNNSPTLNGTCSMNSNYEGDITAVCTSSTSMNTHSHRVTGVCRCVTPVTMLSHTTAASNCLYWVGSQYYVASPDCGQ